MDYVQPTMIKPQIETHEPYHYQNAEYSIYSTAFFVFCTVLGVFIVAPMLPPFGQASATPETIAAFYQEGNLRKKIGLCIMMFGTPFIIPLFALMADVMKRAMGMPLLGSVQYGAGLFGILFTFMMTVSWGTAAFRPERAPELTQALHDQGWFYATWVASATLLQVICICIAVFKDPNKEALFPRWFGYLNAFMIPLALPACIINIFQVGPFAYDGLLGFWVPYVCLFAWFVVMMVGIWKVVARLKANPEIGS